MSGRVVACCDDGDPARASELLSEALELWRGPPLADVAFEDFAQAEIRRLEELRWWRWSPGSTRTSSSVVTPS